MRLVRLGGDTPGGAELVIYGTTHHHAPDRDPIAGARAFTALTAPVITPAGTRIPGLRFGDPRAHALLQALLIHRMLPRGFTNRELRTLIAPLPGHAPEDITAGKMTYDLRRLREHGLIVRWPGIAGRT